MHDFISDPDLGGVCSITMSNKFDIFVATVRHDAVKSYDGDGRQTQCIGDGDSKFMTFFMVLYKACINLLLRISKFA